MKKAIFITVRTGSSRLPKKCLLEILGKPTIVHLIERVKRSKFADGIVLCTTEQPEDDILCELAIENDIKWYRGSTQDKLSRWLGAVRRYSVEFFVTADGDDLFCDPELIDLAFVQYEEGRPDFIEGVNIPCGAFTYGLKGAALEKVCEIKGTDETEMMWVYFKETGLFKVEELRNVPAELSNSNIRMTLDYEDDFKFFSTIIEHFKESKQDIFGLRDILCFLNKHPEVIKLNWHLQEVFLKNQQRRTKLVLKEGWSHGGSF